MTDFSTLFSQIPLLPLTQFDASATLNLSPVDQRHFFYCQGLDAQKFLQGQLTCNLLEIDLQQTRLGLHCSPQGRSLTSFRLSLQAAEQYLFQCHQSLAESFKQQLGKYMVFSKAEFLPAQTQALCVQGPQALSFLQSWWPQLNEKNQVDQQCHNDHGSCIQLDSAQQLFELWLTPEQAKPVLAEAQKSQAQMLEHNFYHWQLIQQGQAVLSQDSSETYVPQMLNFDLINAISFNKGCYTGQEVVARAKYRGQVKRRLQRYLLATNDTAVPAIGSDIFYPQEGQAKKAGQVVNVIMQPQGLEILAVLAVPQIQNPDLYLAHNPDKKLQPLSLPYATFNADENNQES